MDIQVCLGIPYYTPRDVPWSYSFICICWVNSVFYPQCWLSSILLCAVHDIQLHYSMMLLQFVFFETDLHQNCFISCCNGCIFLFIASNSSLLQYYLKTQVSSKQKETSSTSGMRESVQTSALLKYRAEVGILCILFMCSAVYSGKIILR